jgi:hypothetical protein
VTWWCLIAALALSSPQAAVASTNSIARFWNEQILTAIRGDTPHPPVHARNLFHLSVCMYDAWAVYDNTAVGYLFREKQAVGDVPAARREAISYAAWRILKERYVYSKTASNTLARLDAQMAALGYDTNNLSVDTSTPAGVGNAIYLVVSGYYGNDGSRQTNGTPASPYPDSPPINGGYVPFNSPLVTGLPGTQVDDVNRWQPLAIANATDQNGFPLGPIQKFLGAQWLGVRPFCLARSDSTLPWFNPGPPPKLGGLGDAQLRDEVVEVIRRSSELTPDDGVTLDISPGVMGNNPVGANSGIGHPLNPVTGLPYAPNVVKRGDFARVLAEFWADGPSSETPPGHWNSIANAVADNPNLVRRIGGTGPVVDDLEWDVKVYFTLNAALHEAACAAWSLKRYYDGGRPISFIRYMGGLGQSTQVGGTAYHPNGLPLVTNLIELVTATTAGVGGRHQGLPVGRVAIYCWPGQPATPATQHSGAKWVRADSWMPFQKATFVTPAFPGYVSGHSTFSRAAAEVLTAITATPFFPGGMGTFAVSTTNFLSFEQGPSEPLELQWATYYDAADQAGLSRLWGGIHVSVDDLTGRVVGSECGQATWALATRYFDGSVATSPVSVTFQKLSPTTSRLSFATLRGLYYGVQATPTLSQAFTNIPALSFRAVDASASRSHEAADPSMFYRIVTSLSP